LTLFRILNTGSEVRWNPFLFPGTFSFISPSASFCEDSALVFFFLAFFVNKQRRIGKASPDCFPDRPFVSFSTPRFPDRGCLSYTASCPSNPPLAPLFLMKMFFKLLFSCPALPFHLRPFPRTIGPVASLPPRFFLARPGSLLPSAYGTDASSRLLVSFACAPSRLVFHLPETLAPSV